MLGWAGVGSAVLGWAGIGWAGLLLGWGLLGWAAIRWVGLCWAVAGLGRAGICWAGICWAGLLLGWAGQGRAEPCSSPQEAGMSRPAGTARGQRVAPAGSPGAVGPGSVRRGCLERSAAAAPREGQRELDSPSAGHSGRSPGAGRLPYSRFPAFTNATAPKCLEGYLTACKTTEQREILPAPKEVIPDHWLKLGFDVVLSVLHARSFTPNVFLMFGNLAVDILVRKAFGFQMMES